jgi:opacity protein-like surface antigen
VKLCLHLLGWTLLGLAWTCAQTQAPSPTPVDEENYVPPWMKEESKETGGLDWYVAPALGVSFIRNTDINQFSGSTSGTTVSSSNGFLSYDPGFRMDVPIGARITDWFALEFAPGFMVNGLNYLQPNGDFTIGSQTVSGGQQVNLQGDYYQIPMLANFLFTIPVATHFTISAGFSVGGMVTAVQTDSVQGVNMENSDGISTALAFAYAGQFGLDFPFEENMQAGLCYKFTGTGAQDFTGGTFYQFIQADNGTATQSLQAYFLYRF